jgi:hypothetical protein
MTDVTDNFNRANGSLGGNWTAETGFTGLTIASNAVTQVAASWAVSTWNAATNTFQNDQHVQCTATTVISGIVLRWQTGLQNGYLCFANTDGHPYLYRVDSGTFNLLQNTGTVAAGNTLSCSVVGQTFTVAVNGSTQFSFTDTLHYGSGAPGVAAYNNGVVDDFVAGPIVGGGAGTLMSRTLIGVGT